MDDYMARLFAPEALEEAVTVDTMVPAEVIIERVVPETKKMRKAHRGKRAA
jgi:hypothetical protein